MRILIVKLSSLGDVVHAMPVVARHPRGASAGARSTGWSSPASRRCCAGSAASPRSSSARCGAGRGGWWTARDARRDRAPSHRRLRRDRYDAVLDLQGLTKSALIAPAGARPALRPRQPHRGREPRVAGALAGRRTRSASSRTATRSTARASWSARALGTRRRHRRDVRPAPRARAGAGRCGTDLALHPRHARAPTSCGPRRAGSSSAGASSTPAGAIALPQAGADGGRRAPQRIAAALGAAGDGLAGARPRRGRSTGCGDVQARSASTAGSSHIAVALDLPHVQIYNFPTAWRTGPQPRHGHAAPGVGRRRRRRRRSTRSGRRGRRVAPTRLHAMQPSARRRVASRRERRPRASALGAPAYSAAAARRRAALPAAPAGGAAGAEPLYRDGDRRALRPLSRTRRRPARSGSTRSRSARRAPRRRWSMRCAQRGPACGCC